MEQIRDMYAEAIRQAKENGQAAMRTATEAAARDEDVKNYLDDMATAASAEDRAAALTALSWGLYARYFKSGVNIDAEKYEGAFEQFKKALSAFGSKAENSLYSAFQKAGLPAPKEGMNAALAYTARQMAEGQNKFSEKIERKKEEDYSYDAIVSKPDMDITWASTDSEDQIKEDQNKSNKEFAIEIVNEVKKENGGEAIIHNNDTGRDIRIGIDSIKHTINRNLQKAYIQISHHLTSILKNAVAVNELKSRDNVTQYSTVLLGIAETEDSYYGVRFIVNNKTWNAENFDILYSISKNQIKKEGPVIKTPVSPTMSDLGSPSKIKIADFLRLVKDSFEMSSVFSRDTAEKLGMERPYNSRISNGLIYSIRTDTEAQDTAEALESVREDADLYAQMKQDENARAALQMLRQLHRQTTAGGENALIKKGAFEKRLSDIAGKIEEQTGTKWGHRKLMAQLRKIYQAMEQDGYSVGEILPYTRDIMQQVLEAAPGVLVEQDESTKHILMMLSTWLEITCLLIGGITDDTRPNSLSRRFGGFGKNSEYTYCQYVQIVMRKQKMDEMA